jgi:hypothetical protein
MSAAQSDIVYDSWETAADEFYENQTPRENDKTESSCASKTSELEVTLTPEKRALYAYILAPKPVKESKNAMLERLILGFSFNTGAIRSAKDAYSAYMKVRDIRIRTQRKAKPSVDENSKEQKYNDAINVLVAQFCDRGIDVLTLIPSFKTWQSQTTRINTGSGITHACVDTRMAGIGDDFLGEDEKKYILKEVPRMINDWKNVMRKIIREKVLHL